MGGFNIRSMRFEGQRRGLWALTAVPTNTGQVRDLPGASESIRGVQRRHRPVGWPGEDGDGPGEQAGGLVVC